MAVARELGRSRSVAPVLVRLGSFLFFASILVASTFYYRNRPFNLRDAVISRLQSSYDNPSGYLIAAGGTVISAVLILPASGLFFLGLRHIHRRIAQTGAALIGLGLLGAIALGFLAPFSSPYDSFHTGLALLTFFILSAGVAVCLGLAAWSTRRLALWLATVVQFAALPVLVYMVFTSDFPPERSFLSSLAFLEWVLCLIVGASILILTALLTDARTFPAGSQGLHSRKSREAPDSEKVGTL